MVLEKLFGNAGRRPGARRRHPDRRQTLAMVPLRNPGVSWSPPEPPAPVVIELPLERRPVPRPLQWLASKLARREPPSKRRIELDPVGSFVWRSLDGRVTVRALIWLLAAEFQLNRRDAEASLLAFLSTLSGKNLVGFASLTGPEGSRPPDSGCSR